MKVVLVCSREGLENIRVMVKITERSLKNEIAALLQKDKGREAFELMLEKAQVTDYFPPGIKPSVQADMVLVEEFL